MGVYEIETEGGTYQIETEDAPTLGSEASGVWNKFQKGIGGAADVVSMFLDPGGSAVRMATHQGVGNEALSDLASIGSYTKAVPQTPAGKFLGRVAEAAPAMATPGGLARNALSLVGSALAGQVAEEAGAGEGEQLIASILGSFAPSAVMGVEKGLARAGDDFEKMALSVQRSDLQNAAKYAPKGSTGPSPLIKSIAGAKERGVFKGSKDINSIIGRNEDKIQEIGDEVAPILKSADVAAKKAKIKIEQPQWKETHKFLKENSVDADKLAPQLERRMAWFDNEWDGTIQGLNKQKQKLYKAAYTGTTDSKALDQAIARDMRRTIEEQVDLFLVGPAGKQVRATNAKQGEHLALRPLLDKNKAQEEMPGGVAKLLRRMFASPIGGGAAGVGLSVATGNPLPLLLGALGGAATTKTGQFLLSDASRLGARALSPFGGSPIAGLVGSLLGVEGDEMSPPEASASMLGEPSMEKPPIEMIEEPVAEEADPVKAAISEIKSDPYYDALAMTESSWNPKAKNPDSSAKGLFQFINSTAKTMGLDDPFDIPKSFAAVKTLTDQHRGMFGDDPELLYAAHYLGAPVLAKVLKGKSLSPKEKAQADYFETQVLPRFQKNYKRSLMAKNKPETEEV